MKSKRMFSEAWESMLRIFKAWKTPFKEAWDNVKGIVTVAIDDIVAYIAELPGKIVEAIKDIPGKFGEVFSDSFDKVKGWLARGSMVEYIKTLGEKIGLAIDDIPGVFDATFSDAATGVEKRVAAMAAGVAASAKAASSAIASIGSGGRGTNPADIANIPAFPQHILDMLKERGVAPPGSGFTALAAGGIVTSPTLAMIGESGPEAVVPLDKRGGMGGGGTEIHIHAENLYGYSDFIDAVRQANLEGGRLGIGLGAA